MKKLLAAFAIVGFAAFASAQTITFDRTTWDYGKIKPGSDGHRFFTVKNTGDKPLIISKVQASCGCTTPEWSQEPILPGKTAQIKVGYNTNIVDPNGFNKIIEVYSNDPKNSRSVISIKGTVDPNAPETTVAAVAQDVKQAAKVTGKAVSTAAKKTARAAKKGYKAAKSELKK